MKFKVTSSDQTAATNKYAIKWAGTSRVTNTFCQYANTSTYECVDPATSGTNVSFVGNEIAYRLYKCSTEAAYNAAAPASLTNCTALISETAAPYSAAQREANIVTSQTITPSSTNYYVMVITIYNKTTAQDYQQGRTFVGAVTVVGETN